MLLVEFASGCCCTPPAGVGTAHYLRMVLDSDFAVYPCVGDHSDVSCHSDSMVLLVIDCFVKVSHLFLPVRWMVSVLTG